MRCKPGIVYKSLWVVGAVLILISIPLYKQYAVFYTLLISGVAMLGAGLVLWVRDQSNGQSRCNKFDRLEPEIGVEVDLDLDVDIDANGRHGKSVLAVVAPTQSPAAPVLVSAQHAEPAVAAAAAEKSIGTEPPTSKKKKAIKSSLKKGTGKSSKKETVRLSEKANVKEFSKFDAPDMVAGKAAFTIDTKGTPADVFLPSPFLAEGFTSRRQDFVYPTVEDIRTERERFTNRPETIEIDRKRRVGLIREYALELGHPRDGSLVPFISTLTS